MRVLVTGGAGFIGSHLCARLLRDGVAVTCLDNFSTAGERSLLDIASHSRFDVVRADVQQPIPWSIGHVDAVYHLACPASPADYQANPIQTMRTNVLGALNVLDFAYQNNARVLLASTSEVYGEPEQHPQSESYRGNVSTTGPRACYDEGKRAAETMFADYVRDNGTDTAIVRIFNTYGPHMRPDDGRVVTNFITQALSGNPLTVYGDGSQTRSFCYVSDLVDGLIRMMESDHRGPINLGNPVETSILDLARAVAGIAVVDLEVEARPLPVDDPTRRCPDITLARNALDWQPTTSLHDGLTQTIAWLEGTGA